MSYCKKTNNSHLADTNAPTVSFNFTFALFLLYTLSLSSLQRKARRAYDQTHNVGVSFAPMILCRKKTVFISYLINDTELNIIQPYSLTYTVSQASVHAPVFHHLRLMI